MNKYHIVTFGCQMNKSDSERISVNLENKGYKPAQEISRADLIVVNMCSVRQSAVDRILGLNQKLKGLKAKKILTGCILKKDRIKLGKIFDEIRGKETWSPWETRSLNRLRNQPSQFIPISNGCDNFCAYCVVPRTRGPLICRSHKEILEEIKYSVSKGLEEIWLLGQNVNDYKSPDDRKINFAKLLKIANGMPGNFKIRFMSPNPANFSDELIEVMAKGRKIAKFLNLPVQSGDNQILKEMNRSYTVEQYKKLVKKIRGKIPHINLSTDVIVGFPGETQQQFENTVNLFKELKFNIAYISKYSSRPGTLAAKMEDNIPIKEKKRRWKILNSLLL